MCRLRRLHHALPLQSADTDDAEEAFFHVGRALPGSKMTTERAEKEF